MRRFLLLTLIVVGAICANARLLWKVAGNGLEKPSYLFGTHHFISGDFVDSIPGLPQVIDDIDEVYVEIQNDAMKKGSILVSVGAGHLPGENGVISLLRAQGYSVSPISQ